MYCDTLQIKRKNVLHSNVDSRRTLGLECHYNCVMSQGCKLVQSRCFRVLVLSCIYLLYYAVNYNDFLLQAYNQDNIMCLRSYSRSDLYTLTASRKEANDTQSLLMRQNPQRESNSTLFFSNHDEFTCSTPDISLAR